MKLDFNLNTSQRQGISLTTQVQQAIKLLHMTNMEIIEFVEEQFQDNPFIETSDTDNEEGPSSPNDTNNLEIDTTFEVAPYKKQDDENKTVLDNQFETGEAYIPKTNLSAKEQDFDTLALIQATSKSLYTHCIEYLDTNSFTGKDRIIATRIIEELEPTGWISTDLQLLSHKLSCNLETVEEIVIKLQQIEPAGLFARNLKECLQLQAIDQEVYTDKLKSVLDNLHLIANGKFELLKRRSNCSDDEISKIFKIIKSFDPKPGLKFEETEIPIREPDLMVKEIDNEWVLELNNSNLPNVRVEKNYATDLRKRVTEKKDKKFIQEKVTEAKWLAKAIEKRNETMLKVGTEIVKRQTEFLEKGLQFIQPMVLKDIAEAVDMHESTISRVTTGSLIQTPQGTMELKSFFSVGLQQSNGTEVASSTSIKFMIKNLIGNEDPNSPISDDYIVETLNSEGIKLARRTVAKYRKMENIPSSFARKRRNIIAGSI